MENLTLLPLADFAASAKVLDDTRLSASLDSVWYLLRNFEKGRRPTLPTGLLWDGYVASLATLGLYYGAQVRDREGRQPPAYAKIHKVWLNRKGRGKITKLPPWFGEPRLHESH